MSKVTEYLNSFKSQAAEWFAKSTSLRKYFSFFQDFFRRESLEKAEWPDIQKIGMHMHCFQSMPLAKGKALGNPNHSIEHYRRSLLFLAHGPGEPAERIRKFSNDPEYRLEYFGRAAISELVAYLFPDQFMFFNARDEFAAEFLGIPLEKPAGGDLVAELESFNKSTRPIAKLYEEIVGRRTDLPVNFELDQFFNWLYETQKQPGISAEILNQLKQRLKEGVPWSKDVEEFANTFGHLKPADVSTLDKEKLWKLWTATKFAQTGTPGLPAPSAKQWEGLRKMTAILCDHRRDLGDRFEAARAIYREAFIANHVHLPILLRTLLILESGRFGTLVTKGFLNLLLRWAGKPEMDYGNPASITSALQSMGELIEKCAAEVGAKSLGERASIPWHLCKIVGSDLAPSAGDSRLEEKHVQNPVGVSYWWLNANPKMWDIRAAKIGHVETYTTHNEAGNKRQKYKHFASVKPGDLVIGYVTSPEKEIVALCEITKGLHTTEEGEVIEFKKIEHFKEPVTRTELQSAPELKNCEPIENNQGSLFTVTEEEYEFIRSIIDERNIAAPADKISTFTRADALAGLFMGESHLDMILKRLRQKKALILQGPPGVGKTFVAKRIAYTLMGQKDDRRVNMVQFHPSYGYEDFVQGYRPSRAGGLERRDGVFYEFARLARNDPERDWFFIIDEINRGNLAKIFGELLVLLEADKRGPENHVALTYSDKDERFYLPANLYLIGTMNTADRSLAMVDFALRRRFAFVTLEPAVQTAAFGDWLLSLGATKALIDRIRFAVSTLNSVIGKERDLGQRFLIGHSFFCPTPGLKLDENWYNDIINTEIKPLLEEYFDSNDRVDKLISEALK